MITGLLGSGGGQLLGTAKDLLGGMGDGAARALSGATQLVGSFIGGRKRRREQRAATAELARRKQKFEQLDTSNPYQNISNPFLRYFPKTLQIDQNFSKLMLK